MGTIVKHNRVGNKRPESNEHLFLPVSAGLYPLFFKRIIMAEIKVMIILSNILGFTLTGIAPFINFSTWQGMVIFVLLVLFWIQKIYFSVKKSNQEMKNRDLSLRQKEHDVNKNTKN